MSGEKFFHAYFLLPIPLREDIKQMLERNIRAFLMAPVANCHNYAMIWALSLGQAEGSAEWPRDPFFHQPKPLPLDQPSLRHCISRRPSEVQYSFLKVANNEVFIHTFIGSFIHSFYKH